MSATVGFVVIYRWRLHPGKEVQFQQAWERATCALMLGRGALGSRLHKAEDDTWLAYAQWPSRSAWEHSRAAGSADPETGRLMKEAVAESFEPILVIPIVDHLQHADIAAAEPGLQITTGNEKRD